MGELAKRLSEMESVSGVNGCSVKRLLESLDSEDQEALTRILLSKASTRSIHATLRKANHRVDRQCLTLHRGKRCLCHHQQGENQ